MRNIIFLILGTVVLGCSGTINQVEEPVSFGNAWDSSYRASDRYPSYLVNGDSSYLFIINNTEWAYFACEKPEAVLRKVQKLGANVIRVQLEGRPYFNSLGYDLWPWGGTRENPDFTAFNEVYWDEVERRIRLAGYYGIGIDLVLYATMRPAVEDVGNQKQYWDYIIKRLSKYSNILAWEIMNEYIANESFQDSAGTYFTRHDPYRHPVCSSDGTTEDALWPQKMWMGLSIVHTCTGQQEGYDLENWYLDIARNTRQHGKPAINNETGREKRHSNNDPVHRRKQSWLFNNAGCFWTWHAWDGCEGINDTTYFYDGWQYLKPLRNYYESIPFWTLQPNFTVCSVREKDIVYATMSAPDRKISVTYCCTKKTGEERKGLKAWVRIRDGIYSISFLNPADLSAAGRMILESKGLRSESEIALPSFRDDLLIEIREINAKEKSLIEGTL